MARHISVNFGDLETINIGRSDVQVVDPATGEARFIDPAKAALFDKIDAAYGAVYRTQKGIGESKDNFIKYMGKQIPDAQNEEERAVEERWIALRDKAGNIIAASNYVILPSGDITTLHNTYTFTNKHLSDADKRAALETLMKIQLEEAGRIAGEQGMSTNVVRVTEVKNFLLTSASELNNAIHNGLSPFASPDIPPGDKMAAIAYQQGNLEGQIDQPCNDMSLYISGQITKAQLIRHLERWGKLSFSDGAGDYRGNPALQPTLASINAQTDDFIKLLDNSGLNPDGTPQERLTNLRQALETEASRRMDTIGMHYRPGHALERYVKYLGHRRDTQEQAMGDIFPAIARDFFQQFGGGVAGFAHVMPATSDPSREQSHDGIPSTDHNKKDHAAWRVRDTVETAQEKYEQARHHAVHNPVTHAIAHNPLTDALFRHGSGGGNRAR